HGIAVSIPQPSTAPSDAGAPRWAKRTRAVRPWRRMSWLASPDVVATKPTPHASCCMGVYRSRRSISKIELIDVINPNLEYVSFAEFASHPSSESMERSGLSDRSGLRDKG